MTFTALDQAATAMSEEPDNDATRLAFYERLASSQLFLLLEDEPVGETIEPRVFELSNGTFVLAFDTEDRLTTFAEGPAPYAALPGRAIVELLADQSIGLGLNLGVAAPALVPSDAIAWLAQTLSTRPSEQDETPERFDPPSSLPETLLTALDSRLALAGGLASLAYLVAVTYSGGRRGHLLALIDPAPGAEATLARAVQEALIFSGLDAGEIDVTFLASNDPSAASLAKVGLRFDLPEPERLEAPPPPGMDPTKPPKLT